MRNRLLICVTVALLASGSFALAQGTSQGATGSQSTDQKSAAPKAGAAKQAQTPAPDKAKASSASQPRDAKGRFTKKTDQPGTSAAAPSAGQPRDAKGRFMKKTDQPGSSAAAPKAKSSATTGLGSSQDSQSKSANSKARSWINKATKAGQGAAGRPAP
jgi:hypothetical protein